jgi:cellulose synthase/poly-beta-1,6-N-acetylglucosamine synthase-like glycosyltransferase
MEPVSSLGFEETELTDWSSSWSSAGSSFLGPLGLEPARRISSTPTIASVSVNVTSQVEGEGFVCLDDPDLVYASRYRLCIRQYEDRHPVSLDHPYFRVDPPAAHASTLPGAKEKRDPIFHGKVQDRKTLAVGIAFYNEGPEELRRTLACLANQNREIKDLVDMHVVLVGDGVLPMNQDTEIYLRYLFCGCAVKISEQGDPLKTRANEKLSQWSSMQNALKEAAAQGQSATFIVQAVARTDRVWRRKDISLSHCFESEKGAKVGPGQQQQERLLSLSVIFKADNRRKHNSEEWMLKAFAPHVVQGGCDFVFLTDAGTLFDPLCLRTLLHYIINHEDCAGCTGRQRVMTAAEQDMDDEFTVSIAKYFRAVQFADYEAGYSMYTAAFSLFGCLPVLPGPCQLMRYNSLCSATRAKPFINSSISMQQQLHVALREEPVLTESPLAHFCNVVKTPIDQTDMVLENLKIAEDRIPSYAIVTHGPPNAYTTWTDGATFKIQAETSLEAWVKQRRRWINGAFASYVWLVFSHPELIWGSQQKLYRRVGSLVLFVCQLISYSLSCITPAIFGATLHLSLETLSSGPEFEPYIITITVMFSVYTIMFAWVHRVWDFVKPLFYFTIFLNAGFASIIVFALVRQFVLNGGLQQTVSRMIIMWGTVIVMGTPFILGLLSGNFKSLFFLLVHWIPYMLFLPTLVGSFSLYSIARLSDTSWGNRKVSAKSVFSEQVTDAQIDRLQAELNGNAGVALLFVTFFIVVIEFLVICFRFRDWFIVGVMCTLFLTNLVQGVMSMIFFLGAHLSGTSCRQIVAGRSCAQMFQCCPCRRRTRYQYQGL